MTNDYLESLSNMPTSEVLQKMPFGDFMRLVRETGIDQNKRLLNLNQVMEITHLRRTRLMELVERGEFPKPQKFSSGQGRPNLWQASKVYEWCSK